MSLTKRKPTNPIVDELVQLILESPEPLQSEMTFKLFAEAHPDEAVRILEEVLKTPQCGEHLFGGA